MALPPATEPVVLVRVGGGFKLVRHHAKECLFNVPRPWDAASCWRVTATIALLSQLP